MKIQSPLKQIQFSCASTQTYCSATQSCLTLCDPMDCNTPGFPVLHHLLKFSEIRVPWVGDAIQPSHPLLSPSPPTLNLSKVSGGWSIGASALSSVLPMNIQGWFPLGVTGLIFLQSKGLSRVFFSNNNVCFQETSSRYPCHINPNIRLPPYPWKQVDHPS